MTTNVLDRLDDFLNKGRNRKRFYRLLAGLIAVVGTYFGLTENEVGLVLTVLGSALGHEFARSRVDSPTRQRRNRHADR